MNRQQQIEFGQQLNDELEKHFMSWTPELSEWYGFAKEALCKASIQQLQVPADKYEQLFETIPQGINLNVVMVLANNLDARTPADFHISPQQFAHLVKLNAAIGAQWEAQVAPVRDQLIKRFKIMQNKPGIHLIQGEA
ncbi:hypothetical protein DXN05_03430 [Deminuibacter soli]|uniref:Uncharacterized protein n=1 Tax=Deminuibacter soli TaxID=2291815 RepID=A0A3E1NQ31_9BACT|nr:hypothetical protein DXN05_03430 [Deminuibacter soli]